MTRNLKKNPYTHCERRVCEYLRNLVDIGGGDDPVGFLIASHNSFTSTYLCDCGHQRLVHDGPNRACGYRDCLCMGFDWIGDGIAVTKQGGT